MQLTPQEVHTIQHVLSQLPHIEKAILFGSRAMGTARPGSDVDIVITGRHASLQDALRAASLLEETDLPYIFDILWLGTITHEPLLQHIRQYGQVLYEAAGESA